MKIVRMRKGKIGKGPTLVVPVGHISDAALAAEGLRSRANFSI
jgi:hypothetical protein